MNTLSTLSRIMRVFGCAGTVFHIIPGYKLLLAMRGYVCPYCGAVVGDITDSPVGKSYFMISRPDLGAPLPHRMREY